MCSMFSCKLCIMVIMRWRNVPTSGYKIPVLMYPIIGIHHRLHKLPRHTTMKEYNSGKGWYFWLDDDNNMQHRYILSILETRIGQLKCCNLIYSIAERISYILKLTLDRIYPMNIYWCLTTVQQLFNNCEKFCIMTIMRWSNDSTIFDTQQRKMKTLLLVFKLYCFQLL